MFDFIDNAFLPFLWVAIGALLMLLVRRLIIAGSRRYQFTKSNEKLVMLFQEHARIANEKLIIEQQIAQCLEDEPVNRREWYISLQEQMHAMPAMVMTQIERFGLAKPPPEDPVIEVTETTLSADEEAFASVTTMDGWTGRASGDKGR